MTGFSSSQQASPELIQMPAPPLPSAAAMPTPGGCRDEATGEYKPCCDEQLDISGRDAIAGNLLTTAFYNALEVCLDEIRSEPRRILHIGGTRQREFARYMAFLLPSAEIFVVDTDAEETQKARDAIRCRFRFVTADIEALPFEDNFFDLTLGHNLFQYSRDWPQAMREIGRLTTGNFLLGFHRPVLWRAFGKLPGMADALARTGVALPERIPERNEILSPLMQYGKIAAQVAPFPWHLWMLAMRPLREERLVLSND